MNEKLSLKTTDFDDALQIYFCSDVNRKRRERPNWFEHLTVNVRLWMIVTVELVLVRQVLVCHSGPV